ncbi:class I SAM-dependent methyltransferase [Paenibacillus sp. HWE-109]|uniref:class I SAM-dependent methyltransferase n=1 Tax=Paenibacillus sp. HWE-109 TaxID=1306526 RepID=UPI001EE085A5|nr:class I SAM-dependent methyltransferase [Paenibacillus sp. HWE-109]UKS26686.1 class I SAM-dependent methyltransferase [Paenibacillus sp. HWE-109]
MAIVQVTSTNPKFSFMIKKNPQSGLMLKSVRKGMSYGWYTNEATFNVYFKDADNDISYKQHEKDNFEYLNVSRYNTPLFPLNAINEYFSTPLKVHNEQDIGGYEHSFFINMIHIELVRYVAFFEKHLKDFTFELTHQAHKSYSLKISTRTSLYQLLHVVSVLCLFLSMFGNEFIDISDSILDKYIKSINVIDAPFYIRSLFVRNFLPSKDRFKKYKNDLEKTSRYDIKFDFGGTGLQRRNFIARALPFNKAILDVGCGEGYYAIPYASKIEDCYYAIDINEELLEVINRKAKQKEIDNIIAFRSIDHFLEQYNGELVDVILTEVIEHMSQDEAKELIEHICRQVAFEQFIITTPNADFNPFYELTGFRHDDHKWEMSQDEFRQWFNQVAIGDDMEVEFVAIGDGVNQIQTTQGVILRKKEG